jgi:hypothetical protein
MKKSLYSGIMLSLWLITVLSGCGGDIITIVVNMARNGDPDVMTGTLTINGYPYDYATGAYK